MGLSHVLGFSVRPPFTVARNHFVTISKFHFSPVTYRSGATGEDFAESESWMLILRYPGRRYN
ncbi:MAG: hypothetical protein ACC655_01510, partial [Rhodothermia bacterium]